MKKILLGLIFALILNIDYLHSIETNKPGYDNCFCYTDNWKLLYPEHHREWTTGIWTQNALPEEEYYDCIRNSSRRYFKRKITYIDNNPYITTTHYALVGHHEHCVCTEEDMEFPNDEEEYHYFGPWFVTDYDNNINSQGKEYEVACFDLNGTIEESKYDCRIRKRCKYCPQPSDPTPAPPEDTNTTHWELVDSVSCEDEDDTLSEACTDANASGVLVQSWTTGCCGENKRCYVSTPVCDEDETLDMNSTPPVCRDDDCTEPDETYNYPKGLEIINSKNSCMEADQSIQADQVCEDANGAWHSTSRTNCCVNALCLAPPTCTEPNTDFPPKAENQSVVLSWVEGENGTSTCATYPNYEQQQRRVECKDEYRCLTSICPKETDEPISSYVSPHNNAFHEDIAIAGSSMQLHYASSNKDDTTIAHGWSISAHAQLRDNKLYYGSGSLYVVEPMTDGNVSLVKTGSKEMIFNTMGQLLYTQNVYTKEKINTFGYDNMGKLVTVNDIYGQITTLERDSEGLVTSITAPTGQRTLLSIDNNGDLTEVQYEDTSSYSFEYENHLMTIEHEPNGNRFLHFYNTFGHIVKVIDAEEGEWNFTSTSNPTYGSNAVVRASGDTIVYKNHFVTNGILKTDKILPSGEVIHYETAIDNSMSSTQSCGMKTIKQYRKNNDGTLYKDTFTQHKVLTSNSVTTPSGLRKESTYNIDYQNNAQRITRTTTTNNKTQTLTRDYDTQTQTTLTPEGKKATITYDAQNRHIIKSEPLFKVKPFTDYATYYQYDNKGRVIQEKFKGRITRYTYDADGHLHTVTDPVGKTTTYAYDVLGRVNEIRYANSHTLQYVYDKNGNMTTLITPSATEHDFAYNGVNKRTNYTSPLQKATTYHYDKQRRVTQVIKPSNKTIDYHYSNGNIDSILYPEGRTDYEYDCQSNPSNITSGIENMQFTYDGTLLTSIVQSGLLEETINYSYNNDFLTKSITYAGKTSNYLYNLDNEMTQAGDIHIKRIYSPWSNYTMYKEGNFQVTYSDAYYGYGSHWYYDNRFQYFNYTQENKAGQIQWKYENSRGAGAHSFTYTYDKRNRLTHVKDSGKLVEHYSYDANGNRASATVHGVTTVASYTLDDQLEVYGDNTYRYDNDGYLQEKVTPEGTTTYEYGSRGELKEVITPSQTITYKHNALNQRVAKLIDGQVVEKYLWKDLTTLLAIYDKDDALLQRFAYSDRRMPLSMTMHNQTYYLHYDQVGTLRVVTNAYGQNIKEITYDTYGNILKDSNPDFKVPFGFAGGLYDTDTKLTRFGYRDYDAYVGKWTAKDPIGFSGGDSNLYGYVLGDPVNFVDPSGLYVNLLIAGAVTLDFFLDIRGGIEYSLYTHYLRLGRDKLVHDILLNCGCTEDEQNDCKQRILEIDKKILDLLHRPILSVPLR
ncbi:MAG: Rhs family protein [uncultured Sulfurovum sp.]|uniref:Rhs family protein n=1 Tax=uncultured Sulfurovum sp. TaxID=269237 RepID=A0A6S6TE79_9BACT|nr:MAG: Rhs family protein [uncultured Sulfurovum sp.]